MDVSQKVQQLIKEEQKKPLPSWIFLVRETACGLALVVLIVVSSIAICTAVFLVHDHDWAVREATHESYARHILGMLPYFWLAAIVFLIGFVGLLFKQMRHGYIYRRSEIIIGGSVVAVIFGAVLATFNCGVPVEKIAADVVPAYEAMVERQEEVWNRPEKGLLSGQIQATPESGFTLIDRRQVNWAVQDNGVVWNCNSSEQTGSQVKLVGDFLEDHSFRAEEVWPWEVVFRNVRCERR
ncbi:MAG: hypothetical protein V1821_04565 [bacterium]